MNRLDIQIRDPFVVPVASDGRYYLYGTTDANPWNARGHGFDAYTSSDLEEWDGPFHVFLPPDDFWGTHDFWAPEVHHHDGTFYMFATFISPTRKRGTQILRSSTPLGPFEPDMDGPITPREWQCLDGTLYVDLDRHPWIVFCREWVEVHDGQICAMPLSDDLRHALGEPMVLFRASAARWTEPRPRRDGSGIVDARVTDGPFLHRAFDGSLLMLWSSVGKTGYVMGYARSETGTIAGPWVQSESPLIYADGGHGMIFRAFDGTLYLAYHSPNNTPEERFRYVKIEERAGALQCVGEADAN